MSCVPDDAVDLVVTSPPYPMIEMWDESFAALSAEAGAALAADEGAKAFESMHAELDKVWRGVARTLKTGGFACVNIGDATRSIGGKFQLFSNHTRVTSAFLALGFDVLPVVLWRKPTNAPNKFMGSGMLPAGAYVTLEHEYVLIFRKGGKRNFETVAEKQKRNESAFFWEERNTWFSDVWDFLGARQKLEDAASRGRSAAFPFELAYRLVNMFSLYGDTVLDPFLGTGTTTVAAIASGRSSVGIEIDLAFSTLIKNNVNACVSMVNRRIHKRIRDHFDFVTGRQLAGKDIKHFNANHQFPVVTRQEKELLLRRVDTVVARGEVTESSHSPLDALACRAIEKKTMAEEAEQLALAL